MESKSGRRSRHHLEKPQEQSADAPTNAPAGSAPPNRMSTRASARPTNGRLSQKLTSSFKSFRLSTLGRPGHDSEVPVQLRENLKISDPVLCTTSSSLYGDSDSDATAKRFRTRHTAPKPPVDSSFTEEDDLVILSSRKSESTPQSTLASDGGATGARARTEASGNVSNKDVPNGDTNGDPNGDTNGDPNAEPNAEPSSELNYDSATLETLPSLFDMFRARAYDDSVSPQHSDCNGTEDAYEHSSVQASQSERAKLETNVEVSTTPQTVEHTECSYSPELHGTGSDASQSLTTSRASTHSTAATCASEATCTTQEFYFEDPVPPKPRKVIQPSRVISTWRPEQLVAQSQRSLDAGAGAGADQDQDLVVSTALDQANSDHVARNRGNRVTSASSLDITSLSSKSSLIMPQPPTKAKRLVNKTAADGPLDETSALLSSLHLPIDTKTQLKDASALAVDANLTTKVDTSSVYREAIARLNEVRQLEVRMLVERIQQLESSARHDTQSVDWTQTFFEKIHGLPRLLPVKSSDARLVD